MQSTIWLDSGTNDTLHSDSNKGYIYGHVFNNDIKQYIYSFEIFY